MRIAAALGARPGGLGHFLLHAGLERVFTGARHHHGSEHHDGAYHALHDSGQIQYIWGQLMAGAVLASIPVGILYFIGQRFVVQGLAAGTVKSEAGEGEKLL